MFQVNMIYIVVVVDKYFATNRSLIYKLNNLTKEQLGTYLLVFY